MLKKKNLIIVFIALILLLIILTFYGGILRHHYFGGDKFKSLRLMSVFIAEIPSNIFKIYDSFSNKNFTNQNIYVENDLHIGKNGFIKYKDHKFNGILLLARYDGNIKKSVVEIVDLNKQKILHKYQPDFQKILDNTKIDQEKFIFLKRDRSKNIFPMKNPLFDEDGGLIFHGSYTPLIKINFCSEIEWIEDTNVFHHSINKSLDGNYWVSSEIYPNSIDSEYIGTSRLENTKDDRFKNKFIDDAITKVSSKGEIIFQKSLAQLFIENNLGYLIFGQQNFNLDPFHLNDIEEVKINSEYFRKGDLFLSARNLSTIIQYRPETDKIIRLINGEFHMQHDIDFIDNKTISIFDNNRINNLSGSKVMGNNKIKYFDFENNFFYERYSKILSDQNVKTKGQGLIEIIDEDTILIEEHEQNRIIIANENDVILEYYNMAEDGKRYNLYWSRYLNDQKEINFIYEKLKNKKCN